MTHEVPYTQQPRACWGMSASDQYLSYSIMNFSDSLRLYMPAAVVMLPVRRLTVRHLTVCHLTVHHLTVNVRCS